MKMKFLRFHVSRNVPKLLFEKYATRWSERKIFMSTLSPLVKAFDSYPNSALNLNFLRKNVGLFGIPCLHEHQGFELMKSSAVEMSDKLIEEAVNPQRGRKMVEIFDHLSDTLCQVADLAEFIRLAHPDAKFSSSAEDASVFISGLVEKLNTNIMLYKALKNVTINGDVVSTDAVDDHVANLFLFDFEQSGIHLAESKRKRVVQLNEYILYLGSMFMHQSQQMKIVSRDSINSTIRHYFARDGNNLIINGLFADCHNEEARESAYKIFLSANNKQSETLDSLLESRNELALSCGFKSYNHRAVKGSVLGNPESVVGFLEDLSASISKSSSEEFNAMRKFKKSMNSQNELKPWDVPYLVSSIKYQKYKIEASSFSPYFSIGCCMEGLNNLFQCLYGITLEVESATSGETWHSDVQKLACKHETEGILGYIYCDFFDRIGKPNHDCHFTIRGGKLLSNEEYQLPIVVLMLNLPSPLLTTPSLLTPSMVENLFHEVGHAMHSMLARTKFQHVTGTRCSTDFAEVPSVLMEYFATDPRVVSSFAKHHKTGEKIPLDMVKRFCASKKLFSATEMQLQVFYSMLDQKLHSSDLSTTSTIKVLEEAQNKYYALPYVANTAWHLTFGHLVGYGAKYYSYLMSRAVASWIWQSKFQDNPFSRHEGEKYRHQVLAHGGGKPPKDIIEDYLNEKVNSSNLVSSLMRDVNQNK